MAEIERNGNMIYSLRGDARFENGQRSITVSEGRIHSATLVGLFSDLANLKLKVGDHAPGGIEGVSGAFTQGLYVLNYSLSRDDSEMGTMTLSLVETDSDSRPYLVTATVDEQAVEKKLSTHPRMRNQNTREQIRLWSVTDPMKQWRYDDGEMIAQYAYVVDPEGASAEIRFRDVDDEWAKKYCLASLYGVENYTIYLPVIEITSKYLRLPGATVDASTHRISGEVSADGMGDIGTYCKPPFSVAGFSGGEWFKTCDRFTQEANGGWSRTEQWTYTNDLRFKWIYEDGVTKEVVE